MKAASNRTPVAAAAAAAAGAVAEAPQGGALAEQFDYGDDAGRGFGSLGRESMAIPFLTILQGQSPELETVQGAKVGMILNSVTGELFTPTEGFAFVPSEGERSFVEWRPRAAGGGIVNRHAADSDLVRKVLAEQKLGKYKVPDSAVSGQMNDLVETYYMYGMLVKADGSYEPAVLSFKSTGIKVFRNWRTKISLLQVALPDGRRINPPPFAHRYRLTTHKEKNNQGEWYAFEVKFDGADAAACRLPKNSDLYQAAKALAESVSSGKVTLAAEAPPPADATAPTDKF